MKKVLLSSLLIIFCVVVIGCQESSTTVVCPPAESKSVLSTTPPSAVNTATRIYPSETAGVIKLEKVMPPQVQAGAEFEFRIKVTNLASCSLSDVVVTDTLSDNFQYRTSNPPATVQGNQLIWFFDGLSPKETKEIVGVAIAAAGGTIQNCAEVAYKMPLCVQTISIQPIISVAMTAPAQVSMCELINYVIKVENSGTGAANNVKIICELPAGLVTVQGSNRIEVPIGTLSAGAAKSISMAVRAQHSGTYFASATAFADGNINVQSPQVQTVVKQPALDITIVAPEVQYIDKEITYEISVTNVGDWPAFNTLIEGEIPAKTSFLRASQGGVLVGNRVMWKIAKLNPGASVRTSVTCMPQQLGNIIVNAKTSAICADAMTASAGVEIKGISAVLLEVIDLSDPIKLGNTTTYRIVVTNQGSAFATNIAVKAMLEPQMEYVSSAGATNGSFANDTITFAPLPSLAPRMKATWEVTVKAKSLGDVRFRAMMNCDQLDREVMETESTNFYE